jgi:chemotaxis protein MotB
MVELLPSLEYLTEELKDEIKSGKMQIRLEPRGLVVSLQQAAFFPSGEDVIAQATYPSIGKVAAVIRGMPNPVRLEGHTDSVPIHNARFKSNWELSAARSIAMMSLLSTRFEIPPERLAIAGYAENVPLESNDSEAGRARNRRVDIVILNRTGLLREPVAAAGGINGSRPPGKAEPAKPQAQNVQKG